MAKAKVEFGQEAPTLQIDVKFNAEELNEMLQGNWVKLNEVTAKALMEVGSAMLDGGTDAQLAAVTAATASILRTNDVLSLELAHLRPEWQAVCAERDQLRTLVERYGADQWRRGNAGKEPQEFDEWRKEQQ